MSRATDFGVSSWSATHGCPRAVGLEGVLEQLAQRLRVGDVLEQLHPLVVLDALGLHRGDRLAARLVALRRHDLARVLERRLEDREDVEGVRRRLAVEQLERGHGERRQRLVEGEVGLQVDGEPHRAGRPARAGRAARPRRPRAARGRSRSACGCGAAARSRGSWLSSSRWRIAANGSPGRAMTLSSIEWVTEKRDVSGSGSAATSRSKVGSPHDTKPSGGLRFDQLAQLLGVVAGLGLRLLVLDDVVGRLHDDGAGGVEAGPPGAAGDLVELAGRQVPGARPVVLGQRRDEHGPDRHVDADAEGVGAADHLEQPGLRERLDQPAVARQHPGVVHADAVPDEPRQRLAEAGREAEAADHLGDLVPLLPGATLTLVSACARSMRRGLGEVHDVDRRPVGVRAAPRASRAPASSRSSSAAGPAARRWRRRRSLATVRRDRSLSKRDTSPRVADISRNCARGSSSSGTCHAHPRSGSA